MAKSKKEKKVERRERKLHLKEVSQRIHERLLDTTALVDDDINYVLGPASPEEAEEPQAKPQSNEEDVAKEAAEDQDRVTLPAAPSTTVVDSTHSTQGRKHRRISWQDLKLLVAERYGPAAAEVTDEHDGNAEDPLFTVQLKLSPHSVPVPRHWSHLRAYLARQADREAAVGVVPAAIAALGVDQLRATKDRRASPNQVAFMSCFMTGSPLSRKTFDVSLSRSGEVFYEGKWLPSTRFRPGVLSQRLRTALGMKPNAPPPWLYSMQAMRRLPPAYTGLRVPGVNAPIPPGAQWGLGQGQWGEPPRADNNAFLFPGVMDERIGEEQAARQLWGAVPPLRATTAAETQPSASHAPSPAVAAPRAASSKQPPPGESPVVVNPVIFKPQQYAPQGRPLPRTSTTPREYVRVEDRAAGGTVAVGHTMVPAPPTVGSTSASPPPPPT